MAIDEIMIEDCVHKVKYYRNSCANDELKAVMLFYPVDNVLSNGNEKTEMVFWPLSDVEKHGLKPGDVFEFHNKVYRDVGRSFSLRSEVEIRKYRDIL